MIMQVSINHVKCLLHEKPTYRFPDINAFYLVFKMIAKISQTVDYATFIELCKRSFLNEFITYWESAKM